MKCKINTYYSSSNSITYYQVYIGLDGSFLRIEEIEDNSVVASATPKRPTNFVNLLQKVDFTICLNSVDYTL